MKQPQMADMVEKFFGNSEPIAVSSSVTIASGASAVVDQEALANDYDTTRPLLIDTIHFQTTTPDWSAFQRQAAQNFGANLGGTLRVLFSLGRHQLSRVPVPVGLYGPSRDGGSLSSNSFQGQDGSYESVAVQDGLGAVEFSGHFVWVLPRPLLVPPNMVLEARVVRSADDFPADVTLSICYLGRQARRPIPASLPAAVPYVGLFEQRVTPTGVFVSGQHDLWNPFAKPLFVERFVGRLQMLFRQTVAEQLAEIAAGVLGAGTQCITVDIEPNATNFFTGVRVSGGLVRFPPTQLRQFDGQNMTLGLQPGIALFDAYRRTFPANATLPARQGYEVTLDARSGLPAMGSLGFNTAFVSMIGWREEHL